MNPQRMFMDAFSQQGEGDPLFGVDPLDDIGVLSQNARSSGRMFGIDPLDDIGQLSKANDPDPLYGTDPLDDIGVLSQNAEGNQQFETDRIVEMLMQLLMG
jgi:hypothetical protein